MILTLDEALASGRGTERSFNCPSADHEDRNASASVNVIKGVWVCYSCAASGVVADHVPTVDEAMAVLRGDVESRIYSSAWLDVFDADHTSPYWVSRVGLTVASDNRCGTDPMTGCPTYPLRDGQGRLTGVVTRHEEANPKYRYPWNTSTSRTLYGLRKPIAVLVLVEGAGDVMALEQSKLPKGWGAAGVFGSGVHYPQIEIIARMNPAVIVAAFDDDSAGRKANERALESEALTDIAPVVSHRWSSVAGKKDAAEVPARMRIAALKTTLQAAGHGDYT